MDNAHLELVDAPLFMKRHTHSHVEQDQNRAVGSRSESN